MLNFYLCRTCGNLIMKIDDGGTTPSCCGKQMVHLTSASTDGAYEKHVPVYTILDMGDGVRTVCVNVGSTPHPTESYHYISWIALETDRGTQIHRRLPGEHPHTNFLITDKEKILTVYAYCNLHGLWKV